MLEGAAQVVKTRWVTYTEHLLAEYFSLGERLASEGQPYKRRAKAKARQRQKTKAKARQSKAKTKAKAPASEGGRYGGKVEIREGVGCCKH